MGNVIQIPAQGRLSTTVRQIETPEFAEFWAAYPRKDAKGAARKAYARSLRKASHDEIMEGLRTYPFDPNPRFWKLPAGWLNDERWSHELSTFDPVLAAAGLTPDDVM